jgi:hypothetical protein
MAKTTYTVVKQCIGQVTLEIGESVIIYPIYQEVWL